MTIHRHPRHQARIDDEHARWARRAAIDAARTPPSEPTTPWLVPMTGGHPDISGLHRTAIRHHDGSLYLERYHLVDTDSHQVRIHHWVQGDDDRAMHDHPWSNVTTVLAGELREHGLTETIELTPGTVVTRTADEPHRIELISADAWTLFVTGPIVRRWGFHTPTGWVHWSDWPHAGRYEGSTA